ncbi:MAG: hypothetical protein OIF40_05875 [Mangrovicoccus sp.]|nr:hypothetical protein [Mangrovicoccus sp.]
MSNETTAAIQALIKQVETLTTTVTDQQKRMDGLYEHNSRLLDQIKDGKRDDQSKPDETAMNKLGFERGKDGNWYPHGTRPAHVLTREEARDPAKYRAAKEAAAAVGATLEISDPDAPEDRHRAGRGDIATTQATVIKDDDARRVYVRRDVLGSSEFRAQYQRLRNDGYMPVSWDQPDELPAHLQDQINDA